MPLIILALAAALLLVFLLTRLLRRERQARQRLELYDQLIDKLSDGVLLIGSDGHIRQHNQAAAHLLGKAGSELLGSPLADAVPQLAQTEALTAGQRLQIISATGKRLALEVCRLGEAGESLALLQPASEPERSQEDIERFKRSQYFARIGTWDWDVDTNRLYWSEAIYAMFGHAVGAVTPSYELFCASVHPDDRERVRAGELRCIETGENHDEEYRVVWPDGSVHWLRETGNVLKNAQGAAVKMMGVVRDITEEKAWASQMHQLAHHDALTGLPNRLVFEDRLSNALERARRNATRVALVFIDLNGFKAINDAHGHAAGDQVLVATAQKLKGALRESDSVARIGGDEFVVILEGLALDCALEEEARQIGGKILDALATPFGSDNLQRIGASLGIAVFPDHAPSMDRLIHVADLAMYEAKRSGENQYRLGNDGQQRASAE
ncbi:sensor domain-containing diguanylate cyclase [Aquipseudomonas guryensis]|jgi:diguanylate cyclase (GGDEF)-like protein/PAS domain S-box-containing protein|uniref:Diguanylate cyclase n=1 Tax=Aquipseudomonas guryensis TaxID=2759165 RepID=A0A7W4DE46_9GAMM|nr:sensor domain-containing diguanylate cyclase [Pseudomonas guryensis]MBB1520937.1 diguanylate cyclase [Pseudomonas guryensis]